MKQTIQTLTSQIKTTKRIILSIELYLKKQKTDQTANTLNSCYHQKLKTLLTQYENQTGKPFEFNTYEEKLEKAYYKMKI